MTAGPAFILGGLTLTPTEAASGSSTRATDGGPDANGLLKSAILDLQAAATKLTLVNSVIPAGSNKTSLAAQLALLTATS